MAADDAGSVASMVASSPPCLKCSAPPVSACHVRGGSGSERVAHHETSPRRYMTRADMSAGCQTSSRDANRPTSISTVHASRRPAISRETAHPLIPPLHERSSSSSPSRPRTSPAQSSALRPATRRGQPLSRRVVRSRDEGIRRRVSTLHHSPRFRVRSGRQRPPRLRDAPARRERCQRRASTASASAAPRSSPRSSPGRSWRAAHGRSIRRPVARAA